MALQQIAEGVFPDLGAVGIDAHVISDSMTVAQARASLILWGNGERTLATAVGRPAHVVRGANLKQPIAIPRGRNIPCWCFPDPGNEESQREAGFLNLVGTATKQLPPTNKIKPSAPHIFWKYPQKYPQTVPATLLSLTAIDRATLSEWSDCQRACGARHGKIIDRGRLCQDHPSKQCCPAQKTDSRN